MLVHEFGQNTLHLVEIKQVHHKIMWYCCAGNVEGYQTLDGKSKILAIGKTSKPPARRSRARGFVAFFIAAESYYNSGVMRDEPQKALLNG